MALQNASEKSLIVVFTDNGSKDLKLEKEINRLEPGLGIYKRKKENTHENKKIVCVFACVFSCPSSFLRGRFLVRVRVFVRVCVFSCVFAYFRACLRGRVRVFVFSFINSQPWLETGKPFSLGPWFYSKIKNVTKNSDEKKGGQTFFKANMTRRYV